MPVPPKSEIAALEVSILERRLYYNQQETQINDLIERGNTLLMELNHDILLASQELKQLKSEIRRVAADKRMLSEDLELLRRELTQLDNSGAFIGIVQLG